MTKSNSRNDEILVVGAGYVGLATAVYLADRGEQVLVIEKSNEVRSSLERGKLHFSEPLLERTMRKSLASARLRLAEPTPEAYANANMIYVAIDSVEYLNWNMRLDTFEQIARWIGKGARPNPAVILKSTNVLGFSDLFSKLLRKHAAKRTPVVLVNPEFLREGFAYEDTAEPWRIVVGAESEQAAAPLTKLYRRVYGAKVPLIVTDRRSAELVKLAANLYLSHRLAFIHEIATYARHEGLDMPTLQRAIGLDPRIGEHYLTPGLGFGGSCLPKDCHLINSNQAGSSFNFSTARTALEINERVLDTLITSLKEKLGKLENRKIAILGAAFKPDIDDTRGSRSVALGHKLIRRGAKVSFFDPHIPRGVRIYEGHILPAPDLTTAVTGASAVIIGTAHRAFERLSPATFSAHMKRKLILDYFGILNRTKWARHGFEFG